MMYILLYIYIYILHIWLNDRLLASYDEASNRNPNKLTPFHMIISAVFLERTGTLLDSRTRKNLLMNYYYIIWNIWNYIRWNITIVLYGIYGIILDEILLLYYIMEYIILYISTLPVYQYYQYINITSISILPVYQYCQYYIYQYCQYYIYQYYQYSAMTIR